MDISSLLLKIEALLEDKKAQDLQILKVQDLTSMTDVMVVGSGTSTTHVRAMAHGLVEHLKKEGLRLIGMEGEKNGEWILLDFGVVLVHLMLPETRKYYELEKLWSVH